MKKTRKAFSLVELLIATGLLGGFLLGVGSFYLSGNKATTKATWRNNTSGNLRRAMKLLQQALDKTAYPTYTSDRDFQEDRNNALFELDFGPGLLSAAPSGVLTFEADPAGANSGFNTADNYILRFTTATPIQDLGGVVGSSPLGKLVRYTFYFADPTVITKHANRVVSHRGDDGAMVDVYLTRLMYRIEEGTYTYAAGTFTLGGFGAPVDRILVNDVNRITFSEFNSQTRTIQVVIDCKDSIDGKHTVTQNLIHMINTAY
jgi:type II secretory pathway pseudopilin PulG